MVVTWCSVPLCKNLASPQKDHEFYPFPERPDMQSLWKKRTFYDGEIVGREAVCCLHFTKDCFIKCAKTGSYFLKADAIPNQYLPRPGESESYLFAPHDFKLSVKDAGLHFSELIRKLKTAAQTGRSAVPKRLKKLKKDFKAERILEKNPYLRKYVLQEAFPNLNYEVLSSLLKRYSNAFYNVSIVHSKADRSIRLRYKSTVELGSLIASDNESMVQLAQNESVEQRKENRELADELDFTGEISFSGEFPNIYKDNYFEKWPTQRSQTTEIDLTDSDHEIDLSIVPETVVCDKCCRLLPNDVASVHLRLCDYRMYQCTTCFAGFLYGVDLKTHIQKTHPEILTETALTGPAQCGKCGVTFFEIEKLTQHIKTHQQIVPQSLLECGLCDATFFVMYDLGRHFLKDHTAKKTEIALKQLSRQCKQPTKVNRLATPYQCGLCAAAYPKLHLLTCHFRRMHNKALTETYAHPQLPSSSETTLPLKRNKTNNTVTEVEIPPSVTLSAADMGGPEGTYDIFLCKQCPARYRTFKEFCKHFEASAHQLLRCCAFCETEFEEETDYNRHINTHDPEALFRCNQCLLDVQSFETMEELHVHRARIHSDAPVPIFKICETCKKGVYKPTMAHHRLVHKATTPIQCTMCPQSFTEPNRKLHMQQHKQTHTTSRICRLCNEVVDKMLIPEHETLYHPEEWPYKCAMCTTQFSTQDGLLKHVTADHTEEEIRPIATRLYRVVAVEDDAYYECKVCLMDFEERKAALMHIRSVHLSKTTCHNCGKTIMDESTMRYHKTICLKPKGPSPNFRHPCALCGKWITKTGTKKNPAEAQKGSPYECVVCCKSFVRQKSLHEHVAMEHSDEDCFKLTTRGQTQFRQCKLCRSEYTLQDGTWNPVRRPRARKPVPKPKVKVVMHDHYYNQAKAGNSKP